MGAATGIAGSTQPEQEGVFLCESEWEVEWFSRMWATHASLGYSDRGPLDVWAVDDVDEDDLVLSPEGYKYLPGVVSPTQLTLLRRDVGADPFPTLG